MTTSKTLAFFGAGPGLANATARRFSREGYRIALVARNRAQLDQRVADLVSDGIDAVGFAFDLTDLAGLPGLVTTIEARLGPITTAIYAPVGEPVFHAAVDLTGAHVRATTDLLTYAPISLWHDLVPGMLARGDGALVVVDGFSAVIPFAGMSGPGPAMAATVNYMRTLNAEIADKGVYAGLLHITAIIERSKSFAAFAGDGEAPKFPTVNPDLLAEELWQLVTRRDRVEAVFPPFPQA